jgi:hypothetical protein
VAVAEDVGGHGDRVAYATLGGITASVDRWSGILDLDPGGGFAASLVGHLD